MVQLVWIKTIQNGIVFALSLCAFASSLAFYNQTDKVVLP